MKYGHNKNTKGAQGWNVKEPAEFKDEFPVERVDLRVPDFDRLVNQKGVRVIVYRSMYCPNVKSVDGAEHEIDCQICNGSGYIDLDCLPTVAFIQTQGLEKLDGAAGYHDGNTVLMSFLIGIELQYFTRIDLVDFTEIYYQRVMRKTGTLIDILKYKACRVNSVVTSAGVRYQQGSHFNIDPNGNIKWISGKAPANDIIYSIHYETHVIFRAVKAMHANRFTQYKPAGEAEVQHMKLNEQWMATKEFLLRRKDINTSADLNEGPFNTHTDTTGDNG